MSSTEISSGIIVEEGHFSNIRGKNEDILLAFELFLQRNVVASSLPQTKIILIAPIADCKFLEDIWGERVIESKKFNAEKRFLRVCDYPLRMIKVLSFFFKHKAEIEGASLNLDDALLFLVSPEIERNFNQWENKITSSALLSNEVSTTSYHQNFLVSFKKESENYKKLVLLTSLFHCFFSKDEMENLTLTESNFENPLLLNEFKYSFYDPKNKSVIIQQIVFLPRQPLHILCTELKEELICLENDTLCIFKMLDDAQVKEMSLAVLKGSPKNVSKMLLAITRKLIEISSEKAFL